MTLIEAIRTFEAEYGIKPSDIQVTEMGSTTVTIDKSVLYQYDPSQKTKWQRFWSWLNDSDNRFNPAAHATKVSRKLGDASVTVSARRRYKQLPIPYFSIPIPIENAGTKVRDYENLATQKIKISLTFPAAYDLRTALQFLIKAAMESDTLDGSPELPTTARRVSWNPIKWVLHAIASLIPRRIAQKINQILPNKWIKATRPYEWGTRFCDFEVNHGFINSGALTSLLVNPVVAGLTFGTGSILCESGYPLCHSVQYGNPPNGIYDPTAYIPSVPYIISASNRLSFFAQTRAKLTPKTRSDYDELIDDRENADSAINRVLPATP